MQYTRFPTPSLVLLCAPFAACSGGSGGDSDPSGSSGLAGNRPVQEVIDFEALTPGEIPTQVFGSLGSGPIAVSGKNPALGAVNAAVVFDSAAPTGGDPDLGTPHMDFGGPGIGAGGAATGPFPNTQAQGNVLIVGEDLVDANMDMLVDDPDDADLVGSELRFDFSALGSVTLFDMFIIDVEADEPDGEVEIRDAMGATLATVMLPTTDDNGAATIDLGAVSGATEMIVRLNGSGAIDDITFQVECSGRIGDLVWNDLNRDGIQDAGEPGIDMVRLILKDGLGMQLAETTTGRNGDYEFTGLCAGTYVVCVDEATVPSGLVPSPCDVGADDTVDNDCTGVTVVLPADDTNDPTIDFGYNSPCDGSIGDFVWHDLNENGIQDAGEPGIENVTVYLEDTMGNVLATDMTGTNGEYGFFGLCLGDYVVEVDASTLPPGFVPSLCDAGMDDTVDNDCSPVMVSLPTDDSHDDTIDFGYTSPCPGSIGDFVWNDLSRDGIQDMGEPGIQGVTLLLKDAGGVVIAMDTTDANGEYFFGGLCAGKYIVEVDASTLPPDFWPAPCDAGMDDTVDNDCSPVCVTLPTDDTQDDTVDFGYVYEPNCTGLIGDFVWLDTNGDGLQDPGEPGIEGVELRLKDDMGVVITMTTTDANGLYEFLGLCAGKYTVEVMPSSLPDDLEPTESNVGMDDEIDSDGSPVCVTLLSDDEEDRSIDFGYVDTAAFHGCTPGYWKQPHHFDSWHPDYHPDMLFSAVFEDAFSGMTLLEVLSQGGGGLTALGRHVVAALLNAASPDVDYPLSVDEVIDAFNGVYPEGSMQDYNDLKDELEGYNELGCPLN